jgi:hypothetical protein
MVVLRTAQIPEHQAVDGAVLAIGNDTDDSNGEEDTQGGKREPGKMTGVKN